MRVSNVRSLKGVKNPYSRRILSNLLAEDADRVFASGPAALKRAVRGLTAAQLNRRAAPGKWPIAWLVHHICDAEVGLAMRFRLALAQSGSKFQAFDQDLWAARLHYDRRDVRESIELYTALRNVHVGFIRRASRRELQRFGIHEERGKESVERLVHMLAGHDLNHLRQIRAIRARL